MTMTKKDIRLIKSSIKHWKRMRDNKPRDGEEPTSYHCSLCLAYPDDSCKGCPILIKTGAPDCGGTPFYVAWRAHRYFGYGSPEFTKAAQAEIDFLTSLLPEEER